MAWQQEGATLQIGKKGDSLTIQAETPGLPALTYTSETSAERITDSSTNLDVEKEPAAVGILDALRPVITRIIAILVLVIIILIIRKWQKQRKQDP